MYIYVHLCICMYIRNRIGNQKLNNFTSHKLRSTFELEGDFGGKTRGVNGVRMFDMGSIVEILSKDVDDDSHAKYENINEYDRFGNAYNDGDNRPRQGSSGKSPSPLFENCSAIEIPKSCSQWRVLVMAHHFIVDGNGEIYIYIDIYTCVSLGIYTYIYIYVYSIRTYINIHIFIYLHR
jgi:hypothetical protein